MLLWHNATANKELIRCSLPDCLSNRIVVLHSVPTAWGDVRSAVLGGHGHLYFANDDGKVRKAVDDGSANDAGTDSTVVWTGGEAASLTRHGGYVYWLDGARNVWKLDPTTDATSQTGVTIPGTEEVRRASATLVTWLAV